MHTNVVPASSCCGATNPLSLEHVDLPAAFRVISQSIRGHVADLHLIVVPLKVLKFHPEDNNIIMIIYRFGFATFVLRTNYQISK